MVAVTFSVSPFANVLVAAVSAATWRLPALSVVPSVIAQLFAPFGEGAPLNAPNVTWSAADDWPPVEKVLSNVEVPQSIPAWLIDFAIVCRAYPAAVVDPISFTLLPETVADQTELRAMFAPEPTTVVLSPIVHDAGGVTEPDAPNT
jgi:hypothetical protein